MPIVATPTQLNTLRAELSARLRQVKILVTGLAAGAANVIPHGLNNAPLSAVYVARNGTPGFETQDADATNLYYTTGAGETSLVAYVQY